MSVEVHCSVCGRAYSVSRDALGRKAKCIACDSSFRLVEQEENGVVNPVCAPTPAPNVNSPHLSNTLRSRSLRYGIAFAVVAFALATSFVVGRLSASLRDRDTVLATQDVDDSSEERVLTSEDFTEGSAQWAAVGYLSATDWRSRMAFVTKTSEIEQKMLAWYGDSPLGYEVVRVGAQSKSVNGAKLSCTLTAKGRNMLGKVVYGEDEVVLDNTPQGFLVNWEDTVGCNLISWKEFKIVRPTQPVSMHAECSINANDTAPRDLRNETYEILVGAYESSEWERCEARVPRESEAGKWLFAELTKVPSKRLILDLTFRADSEEGFCWVTRVRSDRIYDFAAEQLATLTAVVPDVDKPDDDVPFITITPTPTEYDDANIEINDLRITKLVYYESQGKIAEPGVAFSVKAVEADIARLSFRFALVQSISGEGDKVILEDIQTVVGPNSTVLARGTSRSVSWQAFGRTLDDFFDELKMSTRDQVASMKLDIRVDIYAKTGNGDYRLIESVPVTVDANPPTLPP